MIDPMGTSKRGQLVNVIVLRSGGTTARVLTLGAILQDMRVGGLPITIGHPDLSAYDEGPLRYFGAVIGPVAGRVTGASGPLGDSTLQMEANEGPNALHSGQAGLHRKVWSVVETMQDRVRLVTTSEPGEGGLPGARRFTAEYRVTEGALHIALEAQTDAVTWVDLTHHGYWTPRRMAGVDGLTLQISAERFLPLDASKLPTGALTEVAGTPFDFRKPRKLHHDDIIDHPFAMARSERALTQIARLGATGHGALTLRATAPGLVVFTCDGVPVPSGHWHGAAGSGGRAGLALEPQGWPDAPNHASFPSIVLQSGQVWRREIEIRYEDCAPVNAP